MTLKKAIAYSIIAFLIGYIFAQDYTKYGAHAFWITPLSIVIFVGLAALFDWLLK